VSPDEDSAEFNSLGTGDFETVQEHKDDDEETTEPTHLQTGDFESVDPRKP